MTGARVAVIVLAVLALVILCLENRYGQRRGRTLPEKITTRMADFEVTRGRFKRVDLVMDDGRSFEGVWVLDDRWPTFSARRALAGFKAPRVVAVSEHVP